MKCGTLTKPQESGWSGMLGAPSL